MNKQLHIYIDNEEVVCDKNITINEEMLSTSSTILKNCYPKSWETTKDYVSNFYFPKDYSKCKIIRQKNVNFTIDGTTTQNGTPSETQAYPLLNKTGTITETIHGKEYTFHLGDIELCKIGNHKDYIYKENDKWYLHKIIDKITLDGSESYTLVNVQSDNTMFRTNPIYTTISDFSTEYICNYFTTNSASYSASSLGSYFYSSSFRMRVSSNVATDTDTFKTWLSSNNVVVQYVMQNATDIEITDATLLKELNGVGQDLIFCGLVKNTGNISLNPRDPHYVDLQLLDFKDLLSTGETLNYVITGKTIVEAIEQVVASISDYGFIVGNINILSPDDIINAYSTLNKTAYDVFQYIADITQSKWTTRVIDEDTIAIDFYDPTLMPQADAIEYTKEYFEENDIEDMTFNYSTNDYRNKQIMTSNEVYANITQTETLISNGYQDSYMAQNKIGIITSITVNGTPATFATKSEEELGVSADFIYQPGEMTFNAKTTYSAGTSIVITYYPIVRGREIVLNNEETSRIQSQINRKGTISRYENRNDTTSSQELIKIGQSYIKYKGKAEISLKIVSSNNLFNVGQIVEFNAPLEELSIEYMVKLKTIEIITTIDQIFYTFELSSNFNSENAINYFDNQRAKSQGNIGEGETISRAIDLEDTTVIKFYDTSIEEIEVGTVTSLDFSLDSILI